MSPLLLSLAGAALLIGLTGAWSPCGFSMVETIGLSGDGARRRTTIASCIAFAPGAVVGGIATFGLLSALGELVHGVGGRAAYLVAAAIAVAAAVAEARGTRIVPQIRRQLPERWRWTMPMPLAAALYGILLGLGFTTFVLSFGVWALAGISLALGDPAAGLVIGAAFGVGRALPVVLVAPVVDRRIGVRCIELMAERPALYRIFRLGDAVTLGLVARGADHGHRHRGPNRGPQRSRPLGRRQGARLSAPGSERRPASRAARCRAFPAATRRSAGRTRR